LRRARPWVAYLGALATTGACTLAAFPIYRRVDAVNIIMLYLLGTTFGALRLGRGPSVLLALANMLAFDYFFVPPVFSFDVEDTKYLFTMAVMLVVALVIAHLVLSVRRHRDVAAARERRTAVLYAMSRELAIATDATAMASAAVRHIGEVFHCTAVVLLAAADDRLAALCPVPHAGQSARGAPAPVPAYDLAVALDVATRGERSIRDAIYVPLQSSRRVNDVIVVRTMDPNEPLPADQLKLLDAFAAQLALALQRVRLAEAAEVARLSEERALLRNTLLASISHDLRTPLAAIAGAGSLIAQADCDLNLDRRTMLGLLIERKARDMSQLLTNILELSQMEASAGDLRLDWHAVEDLVSHSLRATQARLAQCRVALNLPADLPPVLVDATLVVQILGNLLENAAKYTPAGTTVTISAAVRADRLVLAVADDGPGLPPGDPDRLFEKFQRGRSESNIIGVGLGLAICRAAARLHGGDIRALHNPGGGARFEISLPVELPATAALAPELLPLTT
jgi:two-component system sensor histidine kinase KdpD